jgi:hypothetical protein
MGGSGNTSDDWKYMRISLHDQGTNQDGMQLRDAQWYAGSSGKQKTQLTTRVRCDLAHICLCV